MTGSRQVGHLVRELQRRNLRYGIVTMCVGAGWGDRILRLFVKPGLFKPSLASQLPQLEGAVTLGLAWLGKSRSCIRAIYAFLLSLLRGIERPSRVFSRVRKTVRH
jgi:hypothetical protein